MQMEKENCRLAKKRNDNVILSDPEHSEGESKDPHTFFFRHAERERILRLRRF